MTDDQHLGDGVATAVGSEKRVVNDHYVSGEGIKRYVESIATRAIFLIDRPVAPPRRSPPATPRIKAGRAGPRRSLLRIQAAHRPAPVSPVYFPPDPIFAAVRRAFFKELRPHVSEELAPTPLMPERRSQARSGTRTTTPPKPKLQDPPTPSPLPLHRSRREDRETQPNAGVELIPVMIPHKRNEHI
ncbi:uncharacterized protein LOC119339460 [Triticum dicoccoides]|uniref:uncharacterized protein LOC119339460 n=1 Tax=Triticum dicoccoides TaxID=85692 RepID=UPI0018914B6E|nr:uncharacterized protein LOC119339460 [Triticum dicoccoides]